MKQEELKVALCGYLPWEVKMKAMNKPRRRREIEMLTFRNFDTLMFLKRQPILYNLNCLTKPIIVKGYNGGLPFVPMKELHRLNELNHFSKNKESFHRVFVDTIISCEFHNHDGCFFSSDYAQLKYTVETNLGTLIYSFGYNATMNRFDARNETYKQPLGVAYQLDMFDLLNRWKIDFRNLIGQGLAIDVETLNTNCYEH